jgi:hypothetical protein
MPSKSRRPYEKAAMFGAPNEGEIIEEVYQMDG